MRWHRRFPKFPVQGWQPLRCSLCVSKDDRGDRSEDTKQNDSMRQVSPLNATTKWFAVPLTETQRVAKKQRPRHHYEKYRLIV
jgi:hypothetical protein